MALLETLYKEMILEHSKRPRNRGEIPGATFHQAGSNPSCGDELDLYLLVEGGRVIDAKFTGEGCAISQASASMMTEAIKGKTLDEALTLSRHFKAMLQGGEPTNELGDLKVLQGVSRLHARVKCAALVWVTLEGALEKG